MPKKAQQKRKGAAPALPARPESPYRAAAHNSPMAPPLPNAPAQPSLTRDETASVGRNDGSCRADSPVPTNNLNPSNFPPIWSPSPGTSARMHRGTQSEQLGEGEPEEEGPTMQEGAMRRFQFRRMSLRDSVKRFWGDRSSDGEKSGSNDSRQRRQSEVSFDTEQLERLQHSIRHKKERISELSDKQAEARQGIQLIQEQIKQVQLEFKTQREALSTKLIDTLRRVSNRNELRSTLRRMRQHEQELKTQIVRTKHELDEIKKVVNIAEYDAIHEQHSALAQKRESMAKEVDNMQKMIKSNTKEIDTREPQLEEMRGRMEHIRRQNDAKQAELQELRAKLKHQQQEVHALENETRQLRHTTARLEEYKKEVLPKLEELREVVSELPNENDSHNDSASGTHSTEDSFSRKVEEVKNILSESAPDASFFLCVPNAKQCQNEQSVSLGRYATPGSLQFSGCPILVTYRLESSATSTQSRNTHLCVPPDKELTETHTRRSRSPQSPDSTAAAFKALFSDFS